MPDHDDAPIDRPATWENVAVGKAKEAVGHAIGADDLVEEGEEQEEVAHEVRQEYRDEHRS
jgi:uncharacterized protein YjbJ (UPF0337 family)